MNVYWYAPFDNAGEVALSAEVARSNGVNLTVLGADTDDTGKPFRLQTVWTTGTVSVGLLNILLKHEPDKDASNPDATGETDFEVAFPVRIQ